MEPGAAAARARTAPVLFDRSAACRIEVTGADARDFLHGQTSNDVKPLGPGEGQPTTVLTGKGKMRGMGSLHRTGEGFLFRSDPGTAEGILAHLGSFVIMEDATLRDRSADTVELQVHGPGSAAALGAALGIEPPRELPPYHSLAAGPVLVVADRSLGEEGFAVIAPVAEGESLRASLAATAPLAPDDAYEVLRIEAGRPVFGRDLDLDSFPPEGGLEASLAATKGCYTGYEVMARIHTYGHVNRKLCGLLVEGEDVPAAGARVLDGERVVGAVTSACVSPALGPIALAMLRHEVARPASRLRLDDGGAGALVTVVGLPFPRRS